MKYRLGNLISHKCGHGFRHKDSVNKGLPVINGRNFSNGKINTNYSMYMPTSFKNKYSRYVLHPGDILVATIGAVGKIAKYTKREETCLLNQHIYDIKSKNTDILNNSYLYWFLSSGKFHQYIKHVNRGSVQSFVTLHSILNYFITLPSMNIQSKQSKLLNSINSKITLNKQINKNLMSLLSLIWIKIPKSRVIKLGKLMKIKSGKRPLNKHKNKSSKFSIPIVGASKIMGWTNVVLTKGFTITTGRVGTLGVIQRFNRPIWVSDNSFIIKSKYEEIITQILNNYNFKSLNRGSTQPLIAQKDLKNINAEVPIKDKFIHYEISSNKIMNMYFDLLKQNITLNKLKHELLLKFFN